MSWFGSQIDSLVDKATSELLPSEDIETNLQICDLIRSKQVSGQLAARAIKRRLANKNPNVQLMTLKLLEMCVKNCGHHFHLEIAQKDFLDTMMTLVQIQPGANAEVRNKTLELIQSWGIAFRDAHDLTFVCDTYNLLKAQGITFPPVDKNGPGIMLDTSTAPDWTDSDVCMRCRSAFGVIKRKHHCRNCGQTFCQSCSQHTIPLPKYGMEQAVRVCDGCFAETSGQLASASTTEPSTNVTSGLYPQSFTHASSTIKPVVKSAPAAPESDPFDEDLKKALALSMQSSNSTAPSVAPARSSVPSAPVDDEDDPDIAAAIAASLRDASVTATRSTPAVSVVQSSSLPQTASVSTSVPSAQPRPVRDPNELTDTEKRNIHCSHSSSKKSSKVVNKLLAILL